MTTLTAKPAVQAKTFVPPAPHAEGQGACPYCGGESRAPLYAGVRDRLGFAPGEWRFDQCADCGAGIIAPFPEPADLPGFYPRVYGFSLELGKQSAFRRLVNWLEYRCFFRPQYESQVRRVLRHSSWNRAPGQRMLDVGCGTGLRLVAFRRRGFDVEGMDFHQEAVEYLRRKHNIPAVCTDVEGLDQWFGVGSFDLLTAFHVVEHVPDVIALFRRCWKLLKPGGYFVGAVPLLDCIQAQWFGKRWQPVTEAPRHLTLPTRLGLERVCSRTGFEPITFGADSTLNCAGMVGATLLPGSAITHSYGSGRLWSMLKRLLGAALAVTAIPWCWIENEVLRKPSLGIFCARKPVGQTASAAIGSQDRRS